MGPVTGTPSWSTWPIASTTQPRPGALQRLGLDCGPWCDLDIEFHQWRSPNVDTVNAAGLPIMPLVARYDELEDGAITHAIRVEAET